MNIPHVRTLLRRAGALALVTVAVGITPSLQAASITYIGKTSNRSNFQAAPKMGTLGYWFACFNPPGARSDKPTNEHERNGLPSWAGPLVHINSIFDPNFSIRSFSYDGPTRAKGGFSTFAMITLPSGEYGRSGILLDPHAAENTSQTINRIRLNSGVPSSFYFRIVVDTTGGKHNAINRIRARGEHGGVTIDPNTYPVPGSAGFNSVPDVYTFRYDGFVAGDIIKVQFNGMPGGVNNGGSGGASFAGFMFDPVP